MWGRDVAGLRLTFHLAGINNQNFLMRDEQTGTYWQQISGKAVSGPLSGSQLPFVHSDELAVALAITRFRPAITVISAIAAALALIGYWRLQPRKWKRILPSGGAALTIVLVFLARINVFEIMFHPNPHPSFVAASDTKLDGAEKVIAVRMGKEARAYPIRSMSYHHIVNDMLDGAAIVATY